MRKLTIFISLILCSHLVSCNPSNRASKEYDYNDFENCKIFWNSLFFVAKTQYFVYIYGKNCLHCKNIKNDVLSFIDEDIFPTYLLECTDKIPSGLEIEKTIGATSIEDVFILGVPTLLEIDDGVLTSNVAGTSSVMALLYSKKK